MKTLDKLLIVAVSFVCEGCMVPSQAYNVAYGAVCSPATQAEMRLRIISVVKDVAAQLALPTPEINEHNRLITAYLPWRFTLDDGFVSRGTLIFSQTDLETERNRISVVIRGPQNGEDATTRKIRAVVEVELKRVGCGNLSFRRQSGGIL